MTQNKIEQSRIEEVVKEAVARAKAIAITTERPLDDVLVEEISQLFPQSTRWICESCKFRNADDNCICPEMYTRTGELKPPTVYICCSKSFTMCKYYQPLDDKEMRKKLKEAIFDNVRENDVGQAWITDDGLDSILALLRPKIEEAGREEGERWVKVCWDLLGYVIAAKNAECDGKVEQERERVLGILEKEYPAITTWQCWQALRGSK